MRCLVTGNHGYIGYILSHELIKSGNEVVGYDCDYFPIECFGRKDAFESGKKIPQIKKDLRDVSKEDMKGIDAVVHLAALPNDPACDLNPEVAQDINYLATLKVAIAAKEAGVKRFIFASSCSVFGVKGSETVNENDRPAPITPYGVSKLNAETALLLMNSDKFTVTCMRNATCYGVSPRMRFDMVLNNLVGYAYTEGKVKMLSDGTAWRPLVHIEDVAKAYIMALEAPKADVASQIFSVGTENFQVKEIAETVGRSVPGSVIEYAPCGQKDFRSYRASFGKLEKILGFTPKWSAETGARELCSAYKDFGLNRENFQNKEFWAGKYFKYLIDSKGVDGDLRLL
jgi:nucleoside-diphosphate-sugar epimerase